MDASDDYRSEAEIIFRKWLSKTVEILEEERVRLKVQDSKKLKKSLRQTVINVAADVLGGEIHFLTRGRFVDMGAGRKRKAAQLRTRKRIKKRKPKKWYSPAFYGRLNDLQGALGVQLMEKSLQAIRDELT